MLRESDPGWDPMDGRFCPVTDRYCKNSGCIYFCQAQLAEEVSNVLPTYGDPGMLSRAVNNLAGDLPDDARKNLNQRAKDRNRLEKFEGFINNLDLGT